MPKPTVPKYSPRDTFLLSWYRTVKLFAERIYLFPLGLLTLHLKATEICASNVGRFHRMLSKYFEQIFLDLNVVSTLDAAILLGERSC